MDGRGQDRCSRWRLVRACAILAGVVLEAAVATGSDVRFIVSFDDPTEAFENYYDAIEANLDAAGQAWGEHLIGDADIELRVGFEDIASSFGRSLTSVFVGEVQGISVFEQGVAAEIRTGVDPNGDAPDAEWVVGFDYLQNELWFDPDPPGPDADIPQDRTDAYSVILHELGHVLAYNGWRDHFDGGLPGNFMSTFDGRTVFDGENFFFVGASASAWYGAAVPQTFGSIFHVGNEPPRPGGDLIDQLMNGVVISRGTRYAVSGLDLAILFDVGVSVRALADVDGDGNVDLNDYEGFLDCENGPDGEIDSDCEPADLDADGDVDWADFGAFQRLYGPSGGGDSESAPDGR